MQLADQSEQPLVLDPTDRTLPCGVSVKTGMAQCSILTACPANAKARKRDEPLLEAHTEPVFPGRDRDC
jgi:hypothetical protein